MKKTKYIATITTMALAASLCACTSQQTQTAETTTAAISSETDVHSDETVSEDNTEENDSLSSGAFYDYQVDTLVECKDTWFEDHPGEDYFFAITDYDNNGRLEINYATIAGSGAYTTNNIYEINEENNGITKCEPVTEYTEGFFYPDMISDIPVRVFFDGTKYTYIFSDSVPVSNVEYTLFIDTFVLENGKIKIDTLASWYQHMDGTEKITNGEDEEIDNETYYNLVDTVFADQEEISKVITWIPVSESTDLKADLMKSLDSFIGKEG